MNRKMKKLLFIANPVAGQEVRQNFLDVIDRFVKGGYDVTVETTQYSGHAPEIILARGAMFDTIVVSGGDGTLNEAFHAMIEAKNRGIVMPPLGYIPAGTVNDFAVSHDIPTDMIRAAEIIVEGNVRECDVGMLGERPFAYVAAFGSFTDTSYSTPQKMKNRFGKLAYLFHGASHLNYAFHPYRMKIEYDGGVLEGDFVYGSASNSRSIGGMKIQLESKVSLDDGKFEVILFENPSSPHRMHRLVRAMLKRKADGHVAYQFSTSYLRVTATEPVAWTTDGEYGGSYGEVELTSVNRAVKFIVPKECKYFGEAKLV
ncbi:MAG: diacylglycerol kinase family lipid kinase [Firmicutes bacterium]|nr:diacylglycerol kinase family lipid kinase [Bacillota bacterium]